MSSALLRHLLVVVAATAMLTPLRSGASTDPAANESHTIRVASDPSKTLTLNSEMVWTDAPTDAFHAIRFPPGAYALEGEDAEYWYFRSAAPLELRILDGGKVVAGKSVLGGIMLAKSGHGAGPKPGAEVTPAAGYIDGGGTTRIMVWRLDKDFFRREGRDWKRSFK